MDKRLFKSIFYYFEKLMPVLSIFLFLILWELVTQFIIKSKLIPSLSSVLNAYCEMSDSGELWLDLKASLSRAIIGYSLGCLVGIPLGIGTGRIKLFNSIMTPILNLFRSFPPVALVPFAILWFGIAETSKYFLIFWGVVFPVWINTHVGILNIEKNYIWAAKLFGAKRLKLIINIYLPAALPSILTGMRIGIGLCFICVFVAEMSGVYEGVGFRISTSYMVFRVDKMIASLFLLGGLGALSDSLFNLFVRLLFPWIKLKNN